jgi:polar amino acid transport system substrate-binding protein
MIELESHENKATLRSLLFTLAVTVCLFLPHGSNASEKSSSPLTPPFLLVEDSWPPYAMPNGSGLSVSIVQHAFRAVGYEPKIEVRPYARVLTEVENGVADGGFNVTRQTSTEDVYHFGSVPILTASASFYFRKEDAVKYLGFKELPNGIRIGLINGYEYGDTYEKNRAGFSEVRLNQQAQIISMLRLDRIDAGIMFDEVANYTLRSMTPAPVNIVKGFQNHQSNIYVAFSRSRDNTEAYSRLLDQGLEIIKVNGTYDKILLGDIN